MTSATKNYKIIEKTYNTTNVVHEFLVSKNELPTARAINYLNKALREVYNMLLDEIILNQYKFTLGGTYHVHVARKLRSFDKLAVNWFESNKNKARLIAEGKKPAKKIGTTDKGNPKFDDGELWMVFYLDDDYIFLEHNYIPMMVKGEDNKYKPILRGNGKKMITNRGALVWTFTTNVKVSARIGDYKKKGLVKNSNFNLHVRKQNNFI